MNHELYDNVITSAIRPLNIDRADYVSSISLPASPALIWQIADKTISAAQIIVRWTDNSHVSQLCETDDSERIYETGKLFSTLSLT